MHGPQIVLVLVLFLVLSNRTPSDFECANREKDYEKEKENEFRTADTFRYASIANAPPYHAIP